MHIVRLFCPVLAWVALAVSCLGPACPAKAVAAEKRQKAPGLRMLDISGEAHRHVIVAQGSHTIYQGHPDTLLMPDGKTMFCVWTLNHGWGEPRMKRSSDAGKTWTDMQAPEDWNYWNQQTNPPHSSLGGKGRGWLPMIHRLVDLNRKARLFIWDRGKDNRMIQSVSEDGGKTWSSMKENGLRGCIEPTMNVIALNGGKKHLMWFTDWQPSVNQAISHDGGLSWQQQSDVIDTSELPGVKMIEPGVIQSPDGKQLLMLIRDFATGRKYNSQRSLSDDEGQTWSKPRKLQAPLTGDRHCPMYAPDGRLVVAMRDTLPGSPTRGHYIAWVGRYQDVVDGNDGQYRVKLLHSHAGGDCAYSRLHLLPDGTIIGTTYIKYRSGKEKQSVVSTRFRLDELDRM